jgi:hypothetical protein
MNPFQKVSQYLAPVLVAFTLFFSGGVSAETYSLPQDGDTLLFSSCTVSGGDITCPGSITLANNNFDDITLTQAVTLSIGGNLSVANNAVLNLSNTFPFSISVGGNISFGNNATINANLEANGNINIGNNASVDGNLEAGGNLQFGNNTTVEGNCTASGGNYPSYCSAPLPSPFVEYRFDESGWSGQAGEVIDSSGNDRHATSVGSTDTIDSGQICRAGQFNGSTDYITTPTLSPLQGTASLSFWIRTTSTGSNTGWQAPAVAGVEETGGADDIFWGWIDASGRIGITKGDDFNATKSNTSITDGTFRHVVLTRDASTGAFQIFIDGTLDRSGTRNELIGMVGNGFSDIGRVRHTNGVNANFFDGDLDEILVFDQVINSDQADELYQLQLEKRNLDNSLRASCIVNSCTDSSVISGLPKMEVSSFEVVDTYSIPNATTVNFTQNFVDPPLVFTLPTTEGGNTAAHRIRNVTASGFQIITAEPESEDGAHVAMGLNFLAIESGIYILPDGQRLEACSIETTRAQQALGTDEWESVSFFSDFTDTPAVLGQIQTMANEVGDIPQNPSIPWLTTAISDVTANDTRLALERSETVSGSINQPERIAYLAAEPTAGRQSFTIGSKVIEYEIIRTGLTINGWGSCSVVSYAEPWVDDNGDRIRAIPLASMNSRLGDDDGGWLRRCPENLNNESQRVRLVVDEIRTGPYNYDNNRSRSQPERAGIVVFSDNFVTEAVLLDHLRFTHPASGIICSPSTVQLSACEDSNCSTLYTGNVTATLNPSGANSRWTGPGVVSNQVEFSGGMVELQLRHTQPNTITLDASSTPVPANPLMCISGGNISNCQMPFTDAGFILTAPDLIANRPDGPVTLRAVKSDPSDPLTCAPAFSGDRNIRLWSDYENPNTGTESVSLDGTPINTTPPGTLLSLTFDANAEASIPTIHYADAGQIRLNALYEGSGNDSGLTLEGSDLFVSQPAGFVLTPEDSCPVADANCSNTRQAGSAFDLVIEAKAWESNGDTDLSDNLATPNFQQSNIALSHRLIAPSTGVAGNLDVGQYNHSVAIGGTVTIEQELSEVGVFEIDMTPPLYFGKDLGQHTSAFTARMTPADFSIAVNPGSLAPHCTIGTLFGYSGRALNWQTAPVLDIEAMNARGILTANYTLGNFNKLSAASLARTAPVTDLATLNAAGSLYPVSSTLNPGSLTVTAPGSQRYQFAPNDAFVFTKTLDSRVTPFIPQLAINLNSLIDADTISASALPTDVMPLANFEVRYSRIRLENAFGPETQDLIVPMSAEYYNGTSMVVNTAESCWVYSDSNATLVPSLTSLVAVTDTLLTGEVKPGSELVLEAPGAGNTGSATLTMAVPTWLQDDFNGNGALSSPTADVTFGVYRGHDRIIYWREVEP